MRCAESPRVQAYFDGELDALSAADIERHSEACAECRELLEDLEQMRTALRQDLTYATTPPALRARIMRALDQESTVQSPRLNAQRLATAAILEGRLQWHRWHRDRREYRILSPGANTDQSTA